MYICCKWTYKAFNLVRRFIMLRIVRIYLRLHGVQLKQNLRIYSFPLCRRHHVANIEIGSNVTIYNKLSENPAGVKNRSVLFATKPGSRLVIGNYVRMSGVVLYCTKQIIIEDYVTLGAGVMVYDTDFHPIDAYARRIHDNSKIKSAPVHICEDAWIGAMSIVLKGVTIGPRAVIGAGSVVTQDVPADSIAAGVPAKVVKSIQQKDRGLGVQDHRTERKEISS